MIFWRRNEKTVLLCKLKIDIMDYTLIGFIVYLLIVLVVGFVTYRLNETHSDFFVGGRKLNPWVVAFSERASGESAWLLLGLPGAALAAGFVSAWLAIGCILGIAFYWFFIAKKLRIESENLNAITLPGFFAKKFDDYNIIRVLATLIIVFFFTFYLAAQFVGAGKILNVTFDIPIVQGMIIGAVVIIFYTMMGGFFAVAWTDLFQGILMIATLVILPIAGMIELHESGASLSGTIISQEGSSFVNMFNGKTGWAAIAVVIGGLSWGLGYMGQPHLLTRFMAIKNPGKLKVSRNIALAWAIPAFFGSIFIGLVGIALYSKGFFSDVENIMPYMATNLLPAWLAGVFISGAIAAMMSTADSQLLVVSSSVIEDFYNKILGKNKPDNVLLNYSRIITIVVGIVAFFIAYTSEDLIIELVSYAWSGLGASFGPALLLMLYWRRTTKEGIVAGMITGFVTTIVWKDIAVLDNFITVRFTSFAFAFIAILVVSLLYNKKS